MKTLAYIFCIGLVVLAIGCASLSELVTPATIDKKAVEYADKAGVIDANDYDGYANLYKAKQLAQAVVAANQVNSLALEQLQEKNSLDYSLLNDVVVKNLEIANAREEQLFGETGLLSMGLGLAGFGGFTGLLGLLRKRPGDHSPQDFENAVTTIKGEVSTKEKQFIQVVQGVKKFMDSKTRDGKIDTVIEELKGFLREAQDEDTKKAVAVAKV